MFAPRHTPKYVVKVDGRPLPPPLTTAIREIVVDQSLEMADMFTLVFVNQGGAVSDNPLLQPGKRVEIELGYQENGGQTQSVMDGEIVALKAVFPRKGATHLRVQGYTKHHRLQRGRFVRAFSGLTYAQIAQKIAQDVGLEPAVDATSPAHEMVFQRNQTNLELLGELAARVGFEVFAGAGKLFFRAPTTGGAPIRKLKKGEAILAFRPRVRAALVPNEVALLDWDSSKPQAIDGAAKKDDAGPIMGGKTAATAVAEKLGTATQLLRGVHVEAKPEADAIAKAVLQKATQNLVHADASVTGSPDLRPGFVVDIDGVGDVFSGPYYVNRVVHNFLKQGFTTTLGLRRSSLEKAPAPPPPMPPIPPRPPPVPGQLILARLVDQGTQRPLSNQVYDVLDPSGKVFETGRTDWQGTVHHRVPAMGQYTVRARATSEDAAGPRRQGGGRRGAAARRARRPRDQSQAPQQPTGSRREVHGALRGRHLPRRAARRAGARAAHEHPAGRREGLLPRARDGRPPGRPPDRAG